ncbi:hypothetical protein BFP71_05210 [Roseivirga misakiensis]|uniref:CHAT domain-containing protein n=1 Tax=Roseivirga misakiensis TaxID=1563681 RepID=A0A1E5T6X8_9BACT|nr:hypothetical protein BFP71_05210 [Roseivirga misakiensis]
MVLFLLFFSPGNESQVQERRIKSKYDFGTPELSAAQKLYSAKRYEEALDAYQSILDKALKKPNWEEVVYTMEKKALTLRRLGQTTEMILVMDQAIKLAMNHLPKGHFLISKMYYTRGAMDHRLGNFYIARSYLDTALTYYNSSTSYDSAAYAKLIEYKFYAYQYSEGNQDTLLKALEELVRLEELAQKKNPEPDEMLIWLQSYPVIYIQKGDFEQALAYAIKGYKYAKENRRSVSPRYYAEAQYYLAQVLYYKKDFLRTIEIGNEAMPLVESIPRINMPEYYSFNNLMGIAYMAVGNPNEALPYLQKALEIPANVGSAFEKRNKRRFKAQVKINVGLCYKNLGEPAKGKKYLDESLNEMKSLVKLPSAELHSNYRYLGDFYFLNEDWSKALISYDSALRNGLVSYTTNLLSFPKGDNMEFSYRDLVVLTKKGASIEKVGLSKNQPLNHLDSAKNYVKKTSELLFDRRDDFLASEGKLFLSQNFKELYEIGIDISYEMYAQTGDKRHFEDALNFSKASKAILFLEQSQEFDLVNNNLVSQELKNLFFQSKSDVERLQAKFYELIDNSATSDSVIMVNEQLLQTREEREGLKDSIENFLSSFQDESSLEMIIDGKGDLSVDKGKAFIEFFYGDEHIYVLGKSKSDVSFERVEISNELTVALEEVVSAASSPPNVALHETQLNLFQEQSFLIYRKLLKATLDKFKPNLNHLILVPDEFLSRLPFGLLVEKKESQIVGFNELHYLIKSYSIQYQLSSELVNSDRAVSRVNDKILGIGYLDDGNVSTLGSLPGTEMEIERLEAMVPGKYLLGSEAVKSEFLRQARDYDVLHLAIHGRSDSTNNYQSTLIFNGDETENTMNTNDLYLASLKARLAVLSACESGLGVINKGEGTFSIARGFALVGVPSVVMSLWKVNDRITSDQMVEMYQGFVDDGQTINSALRQSKLNYLEKSDSYNAHPYYWAAFLQLGKDIKFKQTDRGPLPWIYIGLALLTSILLGSVFVKRKRAK